MKQCSYCGNGNLDDTEVCSSCDTDLLENTTDKVTVTENKTNFQEKESKYNRIGGWLILLALARIGDILFSPTTIFSYCKGLYNARMLGEDGAKFMVPIGIGLLYTVILFIMSIYLLILMFKRKRLFSHVMIGFLIFTFVYNIIIFVLIKNINISMKPHYELMVLGSFVGCAIWIPYLLVSERVGKTFVK